MFYQLGWFARLKRQFTLHTLQFMLLAIQLYYRLAWTLRIWPNTSAVSLRTENLIKELSSRRVFFIVWTIVCLIRTLIYFLKDAFCQIKMIHRFRPTICSFKIANSSIDKVISFGDQFVMLKGRNASQNLFLKIRSFEFSFLVAIWCLGVKWLSEAFPAHSLNSNIYLAISLVLKV